MKIYTRTGDDGTTSLVGGRRVSKCCPRLEAYGTVDELSSQIGLLCSFIEKSDDNAIEKPDEKSDEKAKFRAGLIPQLEWIQQKLFCMGGALATDAATTPVPESCRILESDVTRLESLIDNLGAGLPVQHSFILPGGCVPASQAHVARTVCRRAERLVTALNSEMQVPDNVAIFLNRLSDFLFVLARKANQISGCEEILWQ